MVVDKSSNNEDVKDIESVEKPLESQEEKASNKDSQVKTVPLAELLNERKKRQDSEYKIKQYEEAESLKKGEHEKVITNLKAELETLKQQFSEKEEVANKWTNYEQKQRDKYKELIGDMPNFDSMTLEQMEYLSNKINGKQTIDVDTSIAKSKSAPIMLSESEKKKAIQMYGENFTEKEAYEAYAELLKKKKE